MWGFFWEGRGLVFVFAYFCRGSNMKNQTKKKKKKKAEKQRSTHMWTYGPNVVHVSTVYQRGTRDKQHCTSAEVTNVSAIHQCNYCFQTLKQLQQLSITLVASPFPAPIPYPHSLLLDSHPPPPSPATYSHIISPRITAQLQFSKTENISRLDLRLFFGEPQEDEL